jgi:hypothetical protein
MGTWSSVRRKWCVTAESNCLFGQPRADERGKGARVHSLEHALKGGVTGRIIPAIVLIGPAAQGAQLALREFFTGVLEGAIAARAHEG